MCATFEDAQSMKEHGVMDKNTRFSTKHFDKTIEFFDSSVPRDEMKTCESIAKA